MIAEKDPLKSHSHHTGKLKNLNKKETPMQYFIKT